MKGVSRKSYEVAREQINTLLKLIAVITATLFWPRSMPNLLLQSLKCAGMPIILTPFVLLGRLTSTGG